jgi:hypothetical protein
MSRIEELPDDFDEALDLNALTAGHSIDELEKSYAERFRKDPSTGADKPAPLNRSFAEVMSEISKTPLFMNSDDVNDANNTGTSISLGRWPAAETRNSIKIADLKASLMISKLRRWREQYGTRSDPCTAI